MFRNRIPVPVFRTPENTVSHVGSSQCLIDLMAARVAIIASERFWADEQNVAYIDECTGQLNKRLIPASWRGEPDLDAIRGTLSEVTQFSPDVIVAIGGGAILDGARLVWLGLCKPELFDSDDFSSFQIQESLRGKCRFVAAPTTTGSGAEASSAIVVSTKSGKKIPIVSHQLLPDVALLDAKLVGNLPSGIAAASVGDALAHAVEGFTSTLNNNVADQVAKRAVGQIVQGHKALVTNPTPDIIQSMLEASYLAGLVQNHCMTGYAHAIAHQFAAYDVSHANAVTALLPHIVRHNLTSQTVKERYEQLFAGVSATDPIGALLDMLEEIGEKASSNRQRKVASEFDVDQVFTRMENDPSARVTPVALSQSELAEILSDLTI